eukprot:CAMPEP_0196729180 /NCGR_PEP_ID=MMETSP1091-20130531/9650_1 /TAXON_ID=302021 /ORGANISM="Rhodomonas sp., Strain CCMP768" /LENGTH=59 /DNA_ID=CAMNT_0042072039 /DNA_START=84 /DNA_END=260 /DNA_ORIENTATION=+
MTELGDHAVQRRFARNAVFLGKLGDLEKARLAYDVDVALVEVPNPRVKRAVGDGGLPRG